MKKPLQIELTLAEALLVFARTNMDTIIINNLVVRKVEQ